MLGYTHMRRINAIRTVFFVGNYFGHIYISLVDEWRIVGLCSFGLTALNENGFEVPFPQRDIHIRSTVVQAQ